MHRSADEREPWNPAESVTPAEALAASTDGQPTSASEARGDLIPLDADPPRAAPVSAEADRILRGMPVAARPSSAAASPNRGLRASRDDARPGPWALASPSPWRELATIDPFTALVPSDSPGGSWNRVTARRCPT